MDKSSDYLGITLLFSASLAVDPESIGGLCIQTSFSGSKCDGRVSSSVNLNMKTGSENTKSHLDGALKTTQKVPRGMQIKAIPPESSQPCGLALLCLLFDSRAGRTL